MCNHIHMGTKIYNSDITKQIVNQIKASTARDKIPDEIADKVIPTINVSPFQTKTSKPFPISGSLSNATSVTLYTCHATKATYLTGAFLSYIKDATATSTDISIKIIDDESNLSNSLIKIRSITLTAQNGTAFWNSPFPIKLKKGSTITLTSDTNVANIIASGTLMGFEIDE